MKQNIFQLKQGHKTETLTFVSIKKQQHVVQ